MHELNNNIRKSKEKREETSTLNKNRIIGERKVFLLIASQEIVPLSLLPAVMLT